MSTATLQETAADEITPQAVRDQLTLLTDDPGFRSSKRSVQFLRFVVEQTLRGSADQIKERTIGVEVFGRDPSYDTNLDHVVRTAAIELRKRLAIYYGQEKHRHELRMSMVPGSYIPRFSIPEAAAPLEAATDPIAEPPLEASPPDAQAVVLSPAPAADPLSVGAKPAASVTLPRWSILAAVLVSLGLLVLWIVGAHRQTAQERFWRPVLETPGPVLLAMGDVPNGPPTPLPPRTGDGEPFPVIHKSASSTIPFADALTMARVMGIMAAHGKQVVVRREGASSFSELREGPVVLVGAFNNEWSLRLTRQMRYSLALDPDRHLIYIKDAQQPNDRRFFWPTNQSASGQGEAGGPPLTDYALISRIWNSETGQPVFVIGGLYTYGTEAAGEFLADPQSMRSMARDGLLKDPHGNIQIVLATTVTDGTAGPPRIAATWTPPVK